ncbi:MAG: hypothetical protein IKF49_04335 [Clostridia bacterium]|nr:hypothetical protein [Clostridia bacterium]
MKKKSCLAQKAQWDQPGALFSFLSRLHHPSPLMHVRHRINIIEVFSTSREYSNKEGSLLYGHGMSSFYGVFINKNEQN